MQPPNPWKKSPLSFPATPLKKSRSCQAPPPSLFGNLARGSKSWKEGADYVVIPSSLFSYFLLHTSRYTHVLESLFNNIPALTVAVLLTSFILLHNSKIWKGLLLRCVTQIQNIWDSNHQNIKQKLIRIIKKHWNN